MVTIPGASQYVSSATLANQQGISAQAGSVLDSFTTSLLSVGRRLSSGSGIGISVSARQLNESFLSRSTDINQMFSLGVGADATVEGMQQQILALRAGLPDSQLARDLRAQDDGGVSTAETGQAVDTEA